MFHLRLTPPTAITDWSIMDGKKSIVAYEETKKDGTPTAPHYHILLDVEMSKSTLRLWVLKTFNIPPGGMGKNNKYYSIIDAWNDPSYICKSGDIRYNTLYTTEELANHIQAGSKYLAKTPPDSVKAAPSVQPTKETNNDEWSRLLATWINLKRPNYSMKTIKTWIKCYYLQKMRPIPRSGDLNRFAYSIFAISTNCDTESTIHDADTEAFVCEISI